MRARAHSFFFSFSFLFFFFSWKNYLARLDSFKRIPLMEVVRQLLVGHARIDENFKFTVLYILVKKCI